MIIEKKNNDEYPYLQDLIINGNMIIEKKNNDEYPYLQDLIINGNMITKDNFPYLPELKWLLI